MQNLQHFELDLKLCEDTFCPLCHFGVKQTFRELLVKSDLSVAFLPDVITACALLHNVLLGQSHGDVERLLEVLRTEGLEEEPSEEQLAFVVDAAKAIWDDGAHREGVEKHQ